MPKLHLTGDATADSLLSSDANALLIGMLLDQQVPMEKAFSGPAVIAPLGCPIRYIMSHSELGSRPVPPA